ncbi:murein DD-endopeptidase MepM/ murein hydrolase activator NlpD [Dysgonomonadaceae bacterium PH5-43]|nr:murein DD-endopeptidase MepM/ murein hydrolase activator NlpD [Dysgonomonadaceae bacterium PH5-43]
MKKNSGLSFWKKIKFKYKLSFLNENTLEEVFSFRLSVLSTTLTVFAFVILLISLTSIVIINTPIRNYLPGYLDSEIRQSMMENALKTDSLEQKLDMQTRYLQNVMSIFRGDSIADVTHELNTDTVNVDLESLDKSDELTDFIKRFEEEEKYNLNSLTSPTALPENLIFYRPVRGVISSHFDVKEKHYGVDIAAAPRESILATMNGTVIFAGFDANAGYVIHLQHPNGIMSVYKHNAILLKKQGDEVISGEAIAIVGNTGSLSSGNHLHFELWYKGKPVDPEEFIVF